MNSTATQTVSPRMSYGRLGGSSMKGSPHGKGLHVPEHDVPGLTSESKDIEFNEPQTNNIDCIDNGPREICAIAKKRGYCKQTEIFYAKLCANTCSLCEYLQKNH